VRIQALSLTLLGLARAHTHVLGHLRHQGQPVQRGLVDAAHVVVHKQAGQQHGQAENLGAVLRGLRVRVRGGMRYGWWWAAERGCLRPTSLA